MTDTNTNQQDKSPNSLSTEQNPDPNTTTAIEQLINNPSKTIEGTELMRIEPLEKGVLTKQQATRVIHKYANHYKLNHVQALNSIAYWTQNGGYVKKVPNWKASINFPGNLEELDTLRKIIAQVVGESGTVRQLARTLALPISVMANKQDYKGHLFKALLVFNPGLKWTDATYAAEFYLGLEITPKDINQALADRAKARQTTVSKKAKPRKKKGGK